MVRERKSKRRDSLTETLFEKDSELAVDFEITLAAVLGTACLTYPHPRVPALSHLSAFTVLLVTFVRRVAQVSTNADQDLIRDRTTPLLEVVSVLCVLTLLSTAGFYFSTQLIYSSLVWFTVLSFLLFLSTVLIEEKVFGDYAVWWFAKFEDQEKETGSLFYTIICMLISRLSYYLNSRSNSELFKQGMTTYLDTPFSELGYAEIIEAVARMITWLLLVFGLLGILGWLYFGWIGILAVIPTIIARDHLRFWYLAYGDTTFKKLATSLKRSYATALIYVAALVLMHGEILEPI